MEEELKGQNESEVTVEKKEKLSFIKKILKMILYFFLGIFVLNSILYVTLSIPYVQNKLIAFASDKLSSMLNTEVSVDEVRFNLFNQVSLKGLYVEDQAQDTLVYASSIGARIASPLSILVASELRVREIKLDDFFINATAPDSISDYNFQFIVDTFSSTDSTAVDTSSSSLNIVIDDIKLTKGRLAHTIKNKVDSTGLFNPWDIYITDFNANVSAHSINMEDLDIHVNQINAKEKSGLEITNLQGHILSEGSKVRVENLFFSMPNSHLKTESLFYDLETQEFELVSEETEITPQDLLPLTPDLQYLTHNLSLKTRVKGQLPAIEIQNISLTYGDDAVLSGYASLASYEDWGNADLDVNIDKLFLTPRAIESFAKLGDPAFQRPAMLDTLGNLTLDAQMRGKLSNFHLKAKAAMNTGVLNLVADAGIDTTFTNFHTKASLSTIDFNLLPFLGKESGMGKMTTHIDLQARQKGVGNLSAELQGKIDSIDMKNGKVRDLPFSAYYTPEELGGMIDADLIAGHIEAAFSMTTAEKPDIDFLVLVQDVDVALFYKHKLWDRPNLEFEARGKIEEFDIDNLKADITIKDFQFVDKDFNYKPGPIELKARVDSASDKKISINSSLFSANIEGDYQFTTLSDEFSNLMHNYLSNVFPASGQKKPTKANNFNFDFTLSNTEELGYIFDLPFDIIDPLSIKGTINTSEDIINIGGHMPHAHTSSLEFHDAYLKIANKDSAFVVSLNSNVDYGKNNYGLSFAIEGADNALTTVFIVDTDTASINVNGSILAEGAFTLDDNNQLVSTLKVLPSWVNIGNIVMNTLPATIVNVGNRTEVENFGMAVNRKDYLSINGVVSSNRSDTLSINFNKAQVADILQGLGITDIYAEIDGHILANNVLYVPELYTEDLRIKDITIYKDTLGTIDVDTRWNPDLGGIKLVSSLTQKEKKVMELEGLVDPVKETLDLHMDIDRFSVAWVKPFLQGLVSDIGGDISSHLTIKGKLDEPVTEGFLGFNDAKIKVDYTNVTYYISDSIKIDPSRIGFDNLVLRDSEGNTASVSANVTHRNYKNMKYKLDMRTQNLMVLDTRHRTDSLFYGRLFASGTVNIEGSDSGIDMNMRLRNGKKSNINVTIPQVSQATDYKSVVYINVPEEKLPKKEETSRLKQKHEEQVADIPIRIKMNLDVDPNLELGVVIDPQTGDNMNIKGNGKINFTYDMEKDRMTVFGDYKATDGGVRLNLQNIAKLEFRIKEGSKLSFIGDPMSTKFDITAFRRVRADLRTLDQSFEMDNSSPRVQVDCLLGISGDINKMNLTYDIDLYDGSDDQKRKVKSLVNTDEQRIKQFAYLVVSSMFYSNTGGSGANFSDGMWTNLASSALSSGLNAVFGSILGDSWEVGTDFSSGDGTFSDMDMSVNATKRLFNDKLKLHANVGYRSDASVSDNSFIGDFDIEYALNSIWTLKAYSHTNDRFYRQAPTTQGIGIVFTREGPTFKRLFQSFKRRRGAWARQERDSLRRLDSISKVERKLKEDNILNMHRTDTLNQDSISVVIPKDQLPINDSLPTANVSNRTMPMIVIEEKQSAWRREEE